MSKFLVEMELSGLKLKIQGDREDAGLISRAVGQQVATLLKPIDSIIDGGAPRPSEPKNITPSAPEAPKKTRKKKSPNGVVAVDGDGIQTIDFRHDPAKFGNPRQSWNTATKSVWLLYVTKEAASVSEMSSKVIAETFNKQFRQFGPIQTSKVTRDLGRMKSETPAPVQEDATKPDRPWFLTDAGIKKAQSLVAEVLNPGML